MRAIRSRPVICRLWGHFEHWAAEWGEKIRVTRSALHRLATEGHLREAWKLLWRASQRQTSSGVDGETVKQFAAALERNLARTLRHLRNGYTFSALKGIPLPKPNTTKKRIICVPTIRDRLVQRLLCEHLWLQAEALGIVNDVSFGFIRGRGVGPARDSAIVLRREFPWAYKSDIVAFFDRINRDALIDDTARCLKTRSLLPILAAAADCEIDLTDPSVARVVKENGIKLGLGVRQGMPLSPLFSNIALRKFDKEMMRRKHRMLRYADDFIVLCKSRKECEEVDKVVTDALARLSFSIPPLDLGGKTRIAAPDQPIEFLGLDLEPHNQEYRLCITKDQVEKINRELCRLKSLDYLRNKGISIGSLGVRINARIGGLRAAYAVASNFEALDAVLSTAERDILRDVYVKGFGEAAVRALPKRHKAIFGLA